MFRKLILVGCLCCCTLAIAQLGPSRAQIPTTFENLQVLPSEISSNELMDTMRGFAVGLGVTCTQCHVGEDGQPMSTFDFASDEKQSKAAARIMLRMTSDINGQHLPELPSFADTAPQATCGTCHRGQLRPKTIHQELDVAHTAGGVDQAIEKYKALRGEWYGAGAYDFRERPLILFASQFMQQGDMASTVKVLLLGAELFPDAVDSRLMLAMSFMRMGNTSEARKYAEQALAIDPDHARVQALLKQLE